MGSNFAGDMKKNDQHIIGDFTDLLVDRIAERVVERLKEEGLVMAAPSPEAKTDPQHEKLYTIDELCARLKVSPETLHRHRRQGYLKASLYVGNSPRFTEADITEYLNHFNS